MGRAEAAVGCKRRNTAGRTGRDCRISEFCLQSGLLSRASSGILSRGATRKAIGDAAVCLVDVERGEKEDDLIMT